MQRCFLGLWLLGLLALPVSSQAVGAVNIPLRTCYDDVLPLEESIPTISRDLKAIMLSQARLCTKTLTVDHLSCRTAQAKRPAYQWPKTFIKNQVTFKPHNSTEWPQLVQTCKGNSSIRGLTIALHRAQPLQHFGHRMLTDLPALFMLRTYLTDNEVDVGEVRVIFTDDMGLPEYGPEHFKPILHSLGYKSYEPQGGGGAMLCFDQVIFMPVGYYSKRYTTAKEQKMLNMWKAPEVLYDTDPFHIAMIGHLRAAAFGLPSRIPFAPASNRTVVLASRDRDIRKKFGFRQVRILQNEAELYKALQLIPDTNVLQVELGSMSMPAIVELLERTSLFVGYHGAAFDNLVFLPRGASVLEILPKGTQHSPLYPTLAHRTGKEFARYVNSNATRQTCRFKSKKELECLNHYADLVVDVDEVVTLVKSMLHVQQAAMTRYSFDESV